MTWVSRLRVWVHVHDRLPSQDVTRLRALVLAALAVVLLAGCGSVPRPAAGIGTYLKGPKPLPSAIAGLHLVDSSGHARSLAQLRGKVVVVQDTMTLCQETCPMDTAALVKTAREVDAAGLTSKVEFVTVTVDPHRDTPAQLAAYRELYAGTKQDLPNWVLLTGKPKVVDTLWKFLGVYRKRVPQDDPPPKNWRTGKTLTYDIEHSDEAFFFDTRLRERFILEGMPTAGKGSIPARIRKFLSKEGRDNLHKAGDWTTGQALDVIGWLADKRISG